MTLGARLLTAVGGVNVFDFSTHVEATKGDAFDVYLQLLDKSQHLNSRGFFPAGNRYMPADGATLQVEIMNLDAAKTFSRVATQPFAQDDSIWRFSVLATDPVEGTVNLKLTLTEGVVVRTVFVLAALRVSGSLETC